MRQISPCHDIFRGSGVLLMLRRFGVNFLDWWGFVPMGKGLPSTRNEIDTECPQRAKSCVNDLILDYII